MADGGVPDMKAMEAELKKMLNLGPGTSGSPDPQVGTTGDKAKTVVITADDLKQLDIKKKHQKKPKLEKGPNQKTADQAKDTTDQTLSSEVHQAKHKHQKVHGHHHDQPVVHRPKHLEDPPSQPGEQGHDAGAAARKKKRLKKKKRKSGASEFEVREKREDGASSTHSEESEGEIEDGPQSKAQQQPRANTDILRMKYLDTTLTPAVLNELEKERIFPLKKKSTKFANAKYFCRLCDYHCDTISFSRQHAQDARHRRRKEIRIQDKVLKNLPYPSERHISALDDLVERIYTEHGLSDADLEQRALVAQQCEAFITSHIPEVGLQLFGSSLTGFGLKTADLNMDLSYPAGSSPAVYLSNIYKLLLNSEEYHEVQSDFQAKVPSVMFLSPCRTVRCKISVGCEAACLTSQYLSCYRRLDVRCRKLAIVFKLWGQVCEVDRQESGSLPAYCLGVMTVFYMQQCQPPVLPVLWKDLSETSLKRPKLKSDVEQMLADFEQTTYTSHNALSVGALWRDMLLFYGVRFDLSEIIVCIRVEKQVHRAERKWKSKRVAIEDPFSPKRNVARSLYNTRVFDFFYNCLRKACLYFSLPTSHQNLSLYYENKRHTTPKQKQKEHQKEDSAKHQAKHESTGKGKHSPAESEANHKSAKGERDNLGAKDTAKSVESRKLTGSKAIEGFVDTLINDAMNDVHSLGVSGAKEGPQGHLVESGSPRADTRDDLNKGPNMDKVVRTAHVDQSVLKEDKNEQFKFNFQIPATGAPVGTSEMEDDLNEQNEHALTSGTEISSDADIPQNQFLEDCKLGKVDIVESSNQEESSNEEGTLKGDFGMVEPLRVELQQVEDGVRRMVVQDTTKSSQGSSVETNRAGDIIGAKIVTDIVESAGCDMRKLELKRDEEDVMKEGGQVGLKEDAECIKTVRDVSGKLTVTIVNKTKDVDNCSDLTAVKHQGNPEKDKNKDKNLHVNAKKERSPVPHKGETDSDSSDSHESELESRGSSPTPGRRRSLVQSPVGAEYMFEFSLQTLTDGKGPSVFCPICEKEGHLKMDCPEDRLPDISPLPPVTEEHIEVLTGVIRQVLRDFCLSPQEKEERESIRRNLELHLKETFPYAELRLFGSSMNGFGFHGSDLDICVTYRGMKPEDLNFVEQIEAICQRLKQHRGLYGVFPITSAKVPIVKFRHRNSNLEGDMSMYNMLASENTRLLYTYAMVDPRMQTLGYAIKVFAKVCDIGDASKGSLSSYAYVLMMLHYLQHTTPPVIPVLQELKIPGQTSPRENMVESWNAWFFDNLTLLPKVWPHYGKNQQSVGELWLGFFRYYLEEFSFQEQVITIRQFETLSKFEKLWNGKCIAIEDPFDLGHNLGGALSRKMNKYIICTLMHARELYCLPVQEDKIGKFYSIQDYFFDKQLLVDGDPPSDRLCRVCSKIGHIAKECPRILARKEREAADRKRREEQRKREENQPAGTNTGADTPGRQSQAGQGARRDRQMTNRSLSDPGNNAPQSPRGRGQLAQRQPLLTTPDKRLPMPPQNQFYQHQQQQRGYRGPQSPASPGDYGSYPPRWASQSPHQDPNYYRQAPGNGQGQQGYSNNNNSNRGMGRGTLSGNMNDNSPNAAYIRTQNYNSPNRYGQNQRGYSGMGAGTERKNSGQRQSSERHGDRVFTSQQYQSYQSPGSRNHAQSPAAHQQQHGGYHHQGASRDRLVSANKGQRRGKATDFGVTIKNELYENKTS